jgi:DMSO/TMAO reductase YedYZ molybdopterin-dependent catalytic subunit
MFLCNRLYEQAKAHALAERCGIAGQVEFWAMVGKTALDNPDLPIDFVRDLLVAGAERPTVLMAYEYDPETRMLLLLGSHENFYRELKR